MRSAKDWQSDLVKFMIEGGLLGHKQSKIVSKFDTHVTAAQLENELEFLAADDCVQKFNIPSAGRRGGRRCVVWRATNKILEIRS